MEFETLEELVEQRKGYKYLNKNRTSPYQNYKYVFRKGKIFKTDLDTNVNNDCGEGWNLATIPWILKNSGDLLNQIIVEFSIPIDAKIIIPTNNRGKFRTDIIRYEKTYKPHDLISTLKDIKKRLKKYKPINPITSTKMPNKKQVENIMTSVRASVLTSVWASVRASVWASVLVSVGDSVWDSVLTSVGDSVRDSVLTSVWTSVRASVGDSVRDSVWDQSCIAAYKAIVDFLKLDYTHPAFDLIEMGIIVVKVNKKYKVFGKNGKYLGEID